MRLLRISWRRECKRWYWATSYERQAVGEVGQLSKLVQSVVVVLKLLCRGRSFWKASFLGGRRDKWKNPFFFFFFFWMKDEAPFLFGVNKIIKNVLSIPPSGVGIGTPGLSTRHRLSGAWGCAYKQCFCTVCVLSSGLTTQKQRTHSGVQILVQNEA